MPERRTSHTVESDKIQLFSHAKYAFVHFTGYFHGNQVQVL